MGATGDHFRQRAADQRIAGSSVLAGAKAAARVYAGEDAVAQEAAAAVVEKMMAAAVAFTAASTLDAIGDLADILEARPVVNSLAERRRQIMERNDAIRTAFARRDWDKFDALVAGDDARAVAQGGSGIGGGDQTPRSDGGAQVDQ